MKKWSIKINRKRLVEKSLTIEIIRANDPRIADANMSNVSERQSVKNLEKEVLILLSPQIESRFRVGMTKGSNFTSTRAPF